MKLEMSKKTFKYQCKLKVSPTGIFRETVYWLVASLQTRLKDINKKTRTLDAVTKGLLFLMYILHSFQSSK